jgi:hypothetical protein
MDYSSQDIHDLEVVEEHEEQALQQAAAPQTQQRSPNTQPRSASDGRLRIDSEDEDDAADDDGYMDMDAVRGCSACGCASFSDRRWLTMRVVATV